MKKEFVLIAASNDASISEEVFLSKVMELEHFGNYAIKGMRFHINEKVK